MQEAKPQEPTKLGTLYGIGVGPGDPELLTLKAVRALKETDVIIGASSPKNDYSHAYSIVQSYVPEHAVFLRLHFPMTSNTIILEQAWEENAQRCLEILRQGKNVVFLTLGDPLIYSTFIYLMRTLKKYCPELPIELVPGITSFQAAAAKTQTVLCEDKESFALIAGTNSEESIDALVSQLDNVAILKCYKNAKSIYRIAEKHKENKQCTFVSKLGLEGENIQLSHENLPENPPYLSLLFLTKRKEKS